ncbi:MAG: hypothetical protein KY459_01155 [Acidobacteria bacterium]|nr:hypothetical protein [Acidobacteriota bacterium]
MKGTSTEKVPSRRLLSLFTLSLFTLHSSLFFSLFTLHSSLFTLHSSLFTLHSSLFTLLATSQARSISAGSPIPRR